MDNISGNIGGYVDACHGKQGTAIDGDVMVEEVIEPLSVEDEINTVKRIIDSLSKQYKLHSKKELYDAISSQEQVLRSIENIECPKVNPDGLKT